MRQLATALAIMLLTSRLGFAHYNMLLPDKPWAEKGEKVTFTYQFGHPYEHELSDAPKPAALVVITPTGERHQLDIEKLLTPVKKNGADGKKVTAWQFRYTPVERGDHTFVLKTAQIKHDDNTFIEDNVRVVLHVQTQNGWDHAVDPFLRGGGYDIRPYTRPYGLLPGMVFKGQVVEFVRLDVLGKPAIGADPAIIAGGFARVEIEKYNDKPVKNPPVDELVTFVTKADRDGHFVTTLPEAGWWGITAVGGRQGKVLQRATLWVHVDEKK